jgi:hypothetical protein
MHHIVDAGDFLDRIATSQINEEITHHPPEQAQAIDRGERTNRLRSKPWIQLVGEGQQRIALGLSLDNPLANILKRLTIEIGIEATSAMPEHRFLAIFGVLEINSITEKVIPEPLWR